MSEYLGLDTRLALVCKTVDGANALESYNEDGSIDKSSGIHALATNVMGSPIDGRFEVYCLDNLRPYSGRFMKDDPHMRLDLAKPILHGVTPAGFLGFAVNMVIIDKNNMYCMSKAGNTLRETLFYNLFSNLQVYRSRQDMLNVRSIIFNGAVALDGGMIERNGTFAAGYPMSNVNVKFPIRSIQTEGYYEAGRMKKRNWEKEQTLKELQIEQEHLASAKQKYEMKKKEFIHFLTNCSQSATQVGRASTSR